MLMKSAKPSSSQQIVQNKTNDRLNTVPSQHTATGPSSTRPKTQPKPPSQHIKPYQKSNGCTKKPSFQLILALLLVIGLIILHSLLAKHILAIQHPILTVLFVFHYVFLILIAYDYIVLLIIDPADPRLLENYQPKSQQREEMLFFCQECHKTVHIYSYHCHKCDRCAEQFDHHCSFLNNCIGKQNYSNFFRILLMLSTFLLINIGQGVWVFILEETGWRWVGLIFAIYSFLILPEIVVLMCFHLYLSLYLYKTTLEYIRGSSSSQTEERDYEEATPKQRRSSSMKTDKTEKKMDTESQINRDINM